MRSGTSLPPLALAALVATAAPAAAQEVVLLPDTEGNIISSAALSSTHLQRTACKLYESHPDQYDALFVFVGAQLNSFSRTQAGWAVKQPARGLGRDALPDQSARYCSPRLRHAVKMGDIGSFPDDPDARYTGIPSFTLTGVELMGHEFGHHWLAAVTFDRGDGRRRCLLRGFNRPSKGGGGDCDGYSNSDFNQHWSHYFNTGSVMYGSTIEDLGGGSFRLSNGGPRFSQLDQYLMGLRDPAEVEPMFLVEIGGSPPSDAAQYPLVAGQTRTVTGRRLDFTVQDVIRAEGPRVPAREGCHWKAAFVLVHPPASPPTASDIARVDRYRQRWETFYADATDRRGSFDTTLAGTGLGTPECPATGDPLPVDAGVPPDAGALDASPEDAGFAEDAGRAEDASAPEPDAGAPAPGRDAGLAPAPDAGEDVRTLSTDECGCTSAAPSPAPLGLAWLALALGLRRRSRPRR